MLFAYLAHLIKWRSRYSLIFFHIIVRIASQGCGIAFGILGFRNTSVFLAFLILGAEGYFSLVCTAPSFSPCASVSIPFLLKNDTPGPLRLPLPRLMAPA